MRKFARIVESTVAPPTNCLWLFNGDTKYFSNGEWKSLITGGEGLFGYVQEQGEKIDYLDKEIGNIKEAVTNLQNRLVATGVLKVSE